jgi:hypothetical protein
VLREAHFTGPRGARPSHGVCRWPIWADGDLLIMPDIVGKRGAAVQPISPIIHIAFEPNRGNLREMAPDQDLQTGTKQPDTPAAADAPRPGRRSGRGHRGRGRRRRSRAPRPEQASSTEPASSAQPESVSPDTGASGESGARAEESLPFAEPKTTHASESLLPAPAHARPAQPASKASIQAAIDQVNDIIRALKESLEQMDEVLESLEYFERQGDADEREIESLRRTLRQLQRSREGGPHPHRGQS